MANAHVRGFDHPDETIELEGLRSDLVSLGGIAIARTVHPPGWRWSDHVKPLTETEWCQTHHTGVCLSGRLHVVMETGATFEVTEGEVFNIPPGHDGWVLGDSPYVTLDWIGGASWLPTVDTFSERVLLTLVFTDIVDSTELASRLGEVAWGEILTANEKALRDTIVRFRGREVKTTGDGVLAAFTSPARALRCAIALRDVGDGLGLPMRIGVHTGEVETRDGDLHGLVVHEAARIMGAAAPGEVLASSTTIDLIPDGDYTVEDRGLHELRGVPTPKHLFAVAADESVRTV